MQQGFHHGLAAAGPNLRCPPGPETVGATSKAPANAGYRFPELPQRTTEEENSPQHSVADDSRSQNNAETSTGETSGLVVMFQFRGGKLNHQKLRVSSSSRIPPQSVEYTLNPCPIYRGHLSPTSSYTSHGEGYLLERNKIVVNKNVVFNYSPNMLNRGAPRDHPRAAGLAGTTSSNARPT